MSSEPVTRHDQDIAERERTITALTGALRERDEQIVFLGRAVAELEAALRSLLAELDPITSDWQCEVDAHVLVRAKEALGENTPAARTPGQDKE